MNVNVTFKAIDWQLLATQKKMLLDFLWNQQEDHKLWGLIHLLDDIQDQAEQQGHPVEFLMEPETC